MRNSRWRALIQMPWIGHGFLLGSKTLPQFDAVNSRSHSTFYGVLYLGGVITFSLVCLAYAATVSLCISRLRSAGQAIPQALALLLVYGITSYGENMQSLVPSLLISFVWIGGEMALIKSEQRNAESQFRIRMEAPLYSVAEATVGHVAFVSRRDASQFPKSLPGADPAPRGTHPRQSRGVAILLVFLVHWSLAWQTKLASGSAWAHAASISFAIGNSGVDLFFLLSGYLIYDTYLTRRTLARSFFVKRLWRIYPTYLVVFVIYLVAES